VSTGYNDFTGTWKADKMHGHGTYIWADGGTYTGQWSSDGREGLGVYKVRLCRPVRFRTG
jgi:hypothetical protein